MATVTIGKPYFEALLRRAEFHTSGDQFGSTDRLPPDVVTISKAEHDYLLRTAREYHILRDCLFRGGVSQEQLDVLISTNSDGYIQDQSLDPNSWSSSLLQPKAPSQSIVVSTPPTSHPITQPSETFLNGESLLSKQHHSMNRVASFGLTGSSVESPDKDEHFPTELPDVSSQRAPFPRNDQRTILFSNLSDRTTHKNLVSIIRGGRLLDLYLRNDRTATVSFVEGAQEFLQYAKRHDFYIHAKRVDVRWNDRQFHLPNHVANKIAIGATRNLVVRGGAAKLTEEQIRDDLDHIHNLIIIEVTFKDGDVYISTNSVHNALFARTCMMSRGLYKGLRIEWYPDECAAPLPKIQPPSWKAQATTATPKRPTPPTLTNRFNLLNVDGTESGSDTEDDDDDDADGYDGYGVGLGGTWADTSIAV